MMFHTREEDAMAIKVEGLSEIDISRVMRDAVKGSGTPSEAEKKVVGAFSPSPSVDWVKTKGPFQVDIMVTFPCGARHGATCDL